MQTGFFSRLNALTSVKTSVRQAHIDRSRNSTPAARFQNSQGYRLAYDEYGLSSGYPLFYFHDAGSSRLEASFFHGAARQQGYRLIAVDRPGVGCSDYYRSLNTSDFCQDVVLLADQLGLANFAVMSFGAGGVYATTLAHMFPERVTAHLNLAGVPGNVFNETPTANSLTANLIQEMTPLFVKIGVRLRYALFLDSPELMLERMEGFLSFTDRKVLAMPRIRKTLAMDQLEATRSGVRGVAQDLAMCFRKLDFRLHEVVVPTLIWQGSADRLSSRGDCEYLVARLPNARLFRVSHRGHFFFVSCMTEIFQRLRSCADAHQVLAA